MWVFFKTNKKQKITTISEKFNFNLLLSAPCSDKALKRYVLFLFLDTLKRSSESLKLQQRETDSLTVTSAI